MLNFLVKYATCRCRCSKLYERRQGYVTLHSCGIFPCLFFFFVNCMVYVFVRPFDVAYIPPTPVWEKVIVCHNKNNPKSHRQHDCRLWKGCTSFLHHVLNYILLLVSLSSQYHFRVSRYQAKVSWRPCWYVAWFNLCYHAIVENAKCFQIWSQDCTVLHCVYKKSTDQSIYE